MSGTDSAGAQLLHRAAVGGNGAIFQKLLDLGTDEAALTSSGQTTLHCAALGELDSRSQLHSSCFTFDFFSQLVSYVPPSFDPADNIALSCVVQSSYACLFFRIE